MADSTEDYVRDAFKSREETVARVFRKLDKGKRVDGQDADEWLDEWPLSVEVVRVVEVTLSTGGPHEELRIELDSDGGVARVTFGAYWGGERRETFVGSSDALYRYAERIAEYTSAE